MEKKDIKIGAKVKLSEYGRRYFTAASFLNQKGVIADFLKDSSYPINVKFTDGTHEMFKADELELVIENVLKHIKENLT